MPAALQNFCTVCDAAAATASKLKKQEVLSNYLRTLDEDDLRLAVRFFAGRTFSETDERNLSVGGAIVSDVIFSILKLDPQQFWPLVVKSGEVGEALAQVWPTEGVGCAAEDPATMLPAPQIDGQLTLRQMADAFDNLARTGVLQRKRELLRRLFTRCIHPREAAYLTKIIFGDMRTGVQGGVLQAAIAQAFDKPLSKIQRTQLLIGDLDEVAILAKHNDLESARFRLFHPIQFMLATPQETADIAVKSMAGRSFFAEDKLDGIRAQVHKSADRIAIYTRTMDRTDESFPDVVDAMRKVPGEFLLDGEIVPWCDGCVLPFAHIQKRLGRKNLSPAIIRENPAVFIAFDILYHDGRLLMDEPLRERRRILEELGESLFTTSPCSVSSTDEITTCFSASRNRRNEGIVLKDPNSPYSPGRRGKAWLKIKTHLPTLDCVVTAAEYGHGKRKNVLSDYTFAVWSGQQLVNIGKAYSGVTDEEIAQLTELFHKLSLHHRGHIHIVEPKLVLEIAFDQIQRSDRHASGYALRFPRIKRIRWDKPPEEADHLERVAELYDSSANTARTRERPPTPPPQAEPTLFDLSDS
ncbi:MAG TPA: ATP-dependent DNA ligase [Tepidisphaeraceae bacterium]|nr:ATP-dependent DNA ligase [Tepidisphaeraceae bacterium]